MSFPQVEPPTSPPPRPSYFDSPRIPRFLPTSRPISDIAPTVASPPSSVSTTPVMSISVDAPLLAPTPSSDPSKSKSNSLAIGLSVAAVVVVLLLLGVAGVYWFKKKRRTPPPLDKGDAPPSSSGEEKPTGIAQPPPPSPQPANTDHHVVKISPEPNSPPPQPSPSPPIASPPQSPKIALGSSRSSTFTYEELEMITDGFSDDNFLGRGGFGSVHKGVLPNGKEVAVKQLGAGSFQGDREFQAEVEVISRVHHKHLVSLVGYCVSGSSRLLVYEFVPNNTLEFHLHVKKGPAMDWPTRLKIAIGSGKGLAYLHEDCRPKIIHRDIKAANILLDDKFEAMVADFGLAKFAYDNHTHITTRVMGTFGYLAPEYASSGKLTDKSDVFSYGVMLLELITGRRPIDTSQSSSHDSLVDWARPLLTHALIDGNFDSFVDPNLKDYDRRDMTRMIACIAACVRHSARRRPRMSLVVRALEGDVSLDDLNVGVNPGYSDIYNLQDMSEMESLKYGEVMKYFKSNGLGRSGGNVSSEANEATKEYVMTPSSSSTEGQHTQDMEKMKVDGR